MNLVQSVLFHDYRIRFVGNRAYHRSPTETFHDFLECFAVDKLGRKWFETQRGMTTENQHIIVRFAVEYDIAKKDGLLIDTRQELDGSMSAISSGRNLFWLLFCYDLFYLESKNLLTKSLIDRLKNDQYFQGARYELAVIVILLRAGCDVKWIDASTEKTFDFEATHKASGIKLVVEAKSKIRSNNSKRGFAQLLNNAQKKSVPLNTYSIIFIEANLPFEVVPFESKNLLNEVRRALGVQSEVDDKFDFLFITNFPFHYDDSGFLASPPENVLVCGMHTRIPVAIINDLNHALQNYAKIPEGL